MKDTRSRDFVQEQFPKAHAYPHYRTGEWLISDGWETTLGKGSTEEAAWDNAVLYCGGH
jgi:hypothetical protein